MKNLVKWLLPVVALLVLIFIIIVYNNTHYIDKYEKQLKYYEPIYELIKDEAYSTAKVKGDAISLRDESGTEIKTIHLEKGFEGKLLYIEKRPTSVIFWCSGWLDDTDGIMFLENSWTDEAWNGLRRVTKLDGRAYIVYTYR